MTVIPLDPTPTPEERARTFSQLHNFVGDGAAEQITIRIAEMLREEHQRTCDRMRARVERALTALQLQSDGHYSRGLDAGRGELHKILRWLEAESKRV